MTQDIWKALEKIDCEECSVHEDCDNGNLCAEWITKAKPQLLKLRELIHDAYFTTNASMKMNNLVCQMHKITHPNFWAKDQGSQRDPPSDEKET